jgi:hypothetical protein
MTKVTHTLTFTLEVDESHPTAKMFLLLPIKNQIQFCEKMSQDLLTPMVDELNESNSWATLRIVK